MIGYIIIFLFGFLSGLLYASIREGNVLRDLIRESNKQRDELTQLSADIQTMTMNQSMRRN